MEIGYCLAKNLPVIVAIREGVDNSYLPSMIKRSFTYANTEDLAQKIINLQRRQTKALGQSTVDYCQLTGQPVRGLP